MKIDSYIHIFFFILIGILTLLTTEVVSSSLGQETLGLINLFTQLVLYLSIADLGITSASTYALFSPISRGDRDKVNVIYSTISRLYNKISVVILFFGVLIGFTLPVLISNYPVTFEIYMCWAIFVCSTAVSFKYAKYNVLLIAHQKFKFARVIEGSSRSIKHLLMIFVLLYTESLMLYCFLMFSENLISYISYLKCKKTFFPDIIDVDKSDTSIFDNMKKLFFHKLGAVVVFNTDNILLSLFASLNAVAIYASHMMLHKLVVGVGTVLLPVLQPRVGKLITNSCKVELYNLWKQLFIVMLFIAVVFSVVIFNNISNFISLWLGDSYQLPMLTVLLMSLNTFFYISRGATDVFKDMSGTFGDVNNAIIEVVINLILSIVLVQFYGILGVVIGTLISNVIVICFLKPNYMFGKLFAFETFYFIREVFRLTLPVFVTILFCYSILGFFNMNIFNFTWGSMVIKIICDFLITVVVAFITFLISSEFRLVLKKVKKYF